MTIESKAVIAIHGGAGTISRSSAGSAAQEAAYHEALKCSANAFNGLISALADVGFWKASPSPFSALPSTCFCRPFSS